MKRIDLGLTQRQIAEGAGITVQTVSNIEQGKTSPVLSARQFAGLCKALKVDIEGLAELLEPPVEREENHKGDDS